VTSIRLTYPTSIALDESGNIYIADSFNHSTRMVTKNTGIITTVAGIARTSFYRGDRGQATSADLRYPIGIALDRSGNIYIGDAGEDRIRMVSTGIITTVVGKGTLGYSGDGGPATSVSLNSPAAVAMDRSGNNYITDTDNNRICVSDLCERHQHLRHLLLRASYVSSLFFRTLVDIDADIVIDSDVNAWSVNDLKDMAQSDSNRERA
jgi:sugar lactone lactonase YvrE